MAGERICGPPTGVEKFATGVRSAARALIESKARRYPVFAIVTDCYFITRIALRTSNKWRLSMTPNEEVNTSIRANTTGSLVGVRSASTIVLLAGIWFFVSPWVYGAYTSGNAWNSWIIGAAMFLLALTRLSRPVYSSALSWWNMVLGIWAFCSPWIYGYTGNTGRFINSLCVGVVVFVFAVLSHRMATKTHAVPLPHA